MVARKSARAAARTGSSGGRGERSASAVARTCSTNDSTRRASPSATASRSPMRASSPRWREKCARSSVAPNVAWCVSRTRNPAATARLAELRLPCDSRSSASANQPLARASAGPATRAPAALPRSSWARVRLPPAKRAARRPAGHPAKERASRHWPALPQDDEGATASRRRRQRRPQPARSPISPARLRLVDPGDEIPGRPQSPLPARPNSRPAPARRSRAAAGRPPPAASAVAVDARRPPPLRTLWPPASAAPRGTALPFPPARLRWLRIREPGTSARPRRSARVPRSPRRDLTSASQGCVPRTRTNWSADVRHTGVAPQGDRPRPAGTSGG